MVAKAKGKGRAGAAEDLAQDWHLDCLVRDGEAMGVGMVRGWEVPVNLKEVQNPDSRADIT